MNTSTFEPLDEIVTELIRRGLPTEYARRAASELSDHHCDLVEELQAAGWTEPHAALEASRRLGHPRELVKKTVCEYQRSYWCGRWPLITFLLGPVPAFLLAVVLTGFIAVGVGKVVEKGAGITEIQTWAEYTIAYSAKIWLTYGIPSLVVVLFGWLAMRAAIHQAWPCLASIVLAAFVGFVQCTVSIHPTEPNASSFFVGYYIWFIPECCNASLLRFFWNNPWQLAQLLLPLAVTGCMFVCFSRRNKSYSQQFAPIS
jgi:hypothetical protein